MRLQAAIRKCCLLGSLAAVGGAFSPPDVGAQGTARPDFRFGIGTFLTRDRGWNFHNHVEFSAGLARQAGGMDVEAGVSISESHADLVDSPILPPPPDPYMEGVRVQLGLRAPSRTQSMVSVLLGTEVVQNRTDGAPRTTAFAGTSGLGINFGPRGRGTMELRYVWFAKRLGSSRGVLPLTVSWVL